RMDEAGAPESGAAGRLWDTLPSKHDHISLALIGRGSTEADKARRLRILPLPSIGHAHVSQAIRRVLVEVPSKCALSVEDLAWAFSGLEIASAADETAEAAYPTARLVRATDHSMLEHYALGPNK